MKKPKKPRITNYAKKVPKPHRAKKDADSRFDEALKNLPNITNETVASHREDVIGGARKYIYPLAQSKHSVLRWSIVISVVVIVGFFSYSLLAIYKFQSYSNFIYGVSEVIPFPVAKAGPRWVSYQSYLFQLRHYVHYYQSEQQVDFGSHVGQEQLANFKKRALDIVIRNAYVKQLADKHHISVSNQEVSNELALVRRQDRLGGNKKELHSVLNQFYGWTEGDFRTELKQQLLAQKVVSTLDKATHKRAQAGLNQLASGKKFAKVAKKYSDDSATKDNGGKFGFKFPGAAERFRRKPWRRWRN
jgi:hypothetical protein